ncbi:Crp/Fnr family transcriptional regulator [Roseisolibacter sp. H3M3-2]|uniref:Crp/Fnr family transcriptional regulator n=1 Tax=Roseisolibacter sp. H3M3-2 TaxID=3031323 RepID=UPI0023DA8497|nr:Crp/Fnr family transcriptional regulator [Roseisolibacter sp. H3M3-2]MDF1503283.1 Crp/Fnr family transcriptional regulator [Roseisolibacter sp. H3M3-2]
MLDTRNRLLAALPADAQALLAPHLVRVELEARELVYDFDREITHVVFPESAVVSIVGVMADGSAVETGTVGREGMAGVPVVLGADRTNAQAFTQVPGVALRLPADVLRAALAESPPLWRVLLAYTQALMTLTAQGSACNRRHTMVQRCARWLLYTHDQVGRDDFALTHQFLSQMLGVRRATVTEAMGALQDAGAVEYQMGRVRIRDRGVLERRVCECYAIVSGEYERLLGDGAAASRRPPPLDGLTTAEDGMSLLGDGAPPSGDGTPTADDER